MLISTGGLTASISEQSLASLIFCLRCLRLATNHLGSSISTLQSLLTREKCSSDEESQFNPTTIPFNNPSAIASRIEHIKQEIIDTLRKAVDIVSRHAGSALPEPARQRVRMYILSLPARWAAASNTTQSSPHPIGAVGPNGITREEENGWRILTLANESLQMLGNVMTIVTDTLQSAEEWAGRLRRTKRNPSTGLVTPESPRDRLNGKMAGTEKEKFDDMQMSN
jgi:transcriptional repressor OPI1